MSKERLEEIKLLVEELTYEYVHDDTFYGLFVDIDRESIDLLIEQAEIGVNADKDKQTLIKTNIELNARVRELENEYQVRQIEYLEEHIDRLEKENKRYREALEEIRGLYPLRNVGYQVSEIRRIIIKALEGKE